MHDAAGVPLAGVRVDATSMNAVNDGYPVPGVETDGILTSTDTVITSYSIHYTKLYDLRHRLFSISLIWLNHRFLGYSASRLVINSQDRRLFF